MWGWLIDRLWGWRYGAGVNSKEILKRFEAIEAEEAARAAQDNLRHDRLVLRVAEVERNQLDVKRLLTILGRDVGRIADALERAYPPPLIVISAHAYVGQPIKD